MPERYHALRYLPISGGHYRQRGRHTMLRSQGSDDWHLLLSVSGHGLVGTTAMDIAAAPGRIFMWRPGLPQIYGITAAGGRWERYWIHVSPPPSWLDLLRWPRITADGLMAVDAAGRPGAALRAAVRECVEHAHRHEPESGRLALNSLERALLLAAPLARQASGGAGDARVDRTVAAVAGALAEDWTLARLAAVAGVSPPQLVRLCAAHLGETPRRMVERLRLDEACRLLADPRAPVATVSRALGFADVSHFTRRFRDRHQMTPAAWRDRRHHGDLRLPLDYEHVD